jgi:predicted deacylase
MIAEATKTTNVLEFESGCAHKTRVPVYQISGGDSEKHVVYLSGLHGDEWYGVAAILRLWEILAGTNVNGKVTLIPAANVHAVVDRSRGSCELPGDLNREFTVEPTQSTGLLRRFAQALWKAHLWPSDVLVDIHSGGKHDLLVHARLEGDPDPLLPLIGYLGIEFAMRWEKFPEGLLVSRACGMGCRSFAVEYGHGWQLHEPKTGDLADRLLQLLVALRGSRAVPG